MRLVIGADSYIGSELCEYLGAVGTTRRKPSLGRFPFDMLNPIPLPDADITYICAAINGFSECKNNADARQINVETPCAIARDRRVVFLSSCAAETHPETVYGQLKLEAESRLLELGASVFRFGPVIRPGKTVYPDHPYQPIKLKSLVEALAVEFEPGLHRLEN